MKKLYEQMINEVVASGKRIKAKAGSIKDVGVKNGI